MGRGVMMGDGTMKDADVLCLVFLVFFMGEFWENSGGLESEHRNGKASVFVGGSQLTSMCFGQPRCAF